MSGRGMTLVRRCRVALVGVLSGVLVLMLAQTSSAAAAGPAPGPKDKEANDLDSQAIMNDYLGMQFDPAVSKLQKAIKLCGPDKCSSKVLAKIHRDLAVVYIAGQNKLEEGKAELAAALAADPAIELDKDLATPEVQAAFQEVKSGGGGEAKPPKAQKGKEKEAAKPEEKPAATEAASSGDIIHLPPAEGAVLTPLPIYAELAPGVTADKLQVSFKTPTGDWESVPMQAAGTGYGTEIPCKGVGSSPHELQYLIQAYQGKDVAAFSGSRTAPHHVAIKSKFTGEPPTLPGKPAPAQCVEECPPGFPGCGAAEGGDCQTNDDCTQGLVCKNDVCKKDVVDTSQMPAKKLWASLAFQLDFMLFPSEKNICSGANAYKCFWSGGTEYLGRPDSDASAGNEIQATGFKPATMRILLGGDYLLGKNISVGARLGFAFNGGPRDFFPVHIEGRGAYWFVPRTAAAGIKPYVALSAGIAQVNGRIAVNARQTQGDTPDTKGGQGECQSVPGDEPNTVRWVCKNPGFGPSWLDAWRAGGLGFVGVGGGAMYQFNSKLGAYLEVKLAQMFPTSSTTAAAQVGFSMGL